MRPFAIALAALVVAGIVAFARAISRSRDPDRRPQTPGGTVDLLARALAPRLTAAWGQPVVIINRPGAGGSVGAEFVAKSAPDGYTLFISTNSPLTTNLALIRRLATSCCAISSRLSAGENSLVFVANPQLPVKTVKDLIALAKSEPGKLNAATSGNGSTAHLSLATFNRQEGSRSPMFRIAAASLASRQRSPAKCSSSSAISCRSCRRFAITA